MSLYHCRMILHFLKCRNQFPCVKSLSLAFYPPVLFISFFELSPPNNSKISISPFIVYCIKSFFFLSDSAGGIIQYPPGKSPFAHQTSPLDPLQSQSPCSSAWIIQYP